MPGQHEKKKKIINPEGYDISNIVNRDKPFELKFGFLRLKLNLLRPSDNEEAERLSIMPDSNPNRPEIDYDKKGIELVAKAIAGFEYEKTGGPIILDGRELDPKNKEDIKVLINTVPGLLTFIISNTTSMDRMYRTLEEDDIKK